MKKLFLQISILFLSCLTMQGQKKLDFNQIPTIWLSDTLAIADTTDLIFETISEKEFNANYKTPIQTDSTIQKESSNPYLIKTKNAYYELDSTHTYTNSYNYFGFIPDLGCHLVGFCGYGTCDDYLLDHETDVKMSFSAAFDAGILAFLLSPSNDFLLIGSSYDGPDYDNYYDFRAEILLYKIEKGKGLRGIKPYRFFNTEDWSIEDVLWIDDGSIALKVYEGESREAFKYLKARVK